MQSKRTAQWAIHCAIPGLLLLALAACAETRAGNAPRAEIWIGEARSATEATRLELHIGRADGAPSASMTLPDVGVSGWPAIAIEESADALVLTFPSDSGAQTMELNRRADALTGEWREPRFADAARVELHAAPDFSLPAEQRLLIDGPAGKLGASLLLPEGEGPFPAIVFAHGSGPQPRDSTRYAAQVFARAGIAALIFDKRGVGESEGLLTGASFADLAADAIAIANYAAARPEISAVGYFGHSQGGWIGPLAGANWPDTAFVIASAGPAVPPAREAQWDVVRNVRSAGAAPAAEAEARALIEMWHAAIADSQAWPAFDAAMESARRREWFAASGLEVFAEHPGAEFTALYSAFMNYDPMPALRALDAPLLSILAPEDESIDSAETEQILRGLIAQGRPIAIKLYPGYDHSMRRLGQGGVSLRWPEHPDDYFATQIEFVRAAVRRRD